MRGTPEIRPCRQIYADLGRRSHQFEAETCSTIRETIPQVKRERWSTLLAEIRSDGQTQQSWLWAAPAKHSTRQISEVLERIEYLYTLNVHQHLHELPDIIVRRYARRMASRPPSAGTKIKEPARTVEVACFLRYCLFTATDQLILMVQRRIADLWRQVAASIPNTVNWATLYQTLLAELGALSAEGAVPDTELRSGLKPLSAQASRASRPAVHHRCAKD